MQLTKQHRLGKETGERNRPRDGISKYFPQVGKRPIFSRPGMLLGVPSLSFVRQFLCHSQGQLKYSIGTANAVDKGVFAVVRNSVVVAAATPFYHYFSCTALVHHLSSARKLGTTSLQSGNEKTSF